jgi:hypothetical protein
MASTKNNFLNAKPVSKLGGKSGGVRKPSKPYAKPPAKPKSEKPARWDAKTKTERLQEAAKTKPKSPAPRQVATKPVTRTGPVKGPVPPKGSSPVKLPNSSRAGTNLPKVGARAERTATAATQPRNLVKPQTTSSRPLTAADGRPVKMDAKGWPKGTESWADNSTKPSASTPKPSSGTASRVASGAGKLARGAGRLLGAAGIAAAIPLEVSAMVERQKRWDAYKERTGLNKPKPSSSSSGTRTGTASGRTGRGGTTADSMGSRTSADTGRYIPGNQQVKPAAPKPAVKPKPPAPTQSGGGSTQSRSSGGGSSRPAAPAKPASPAAPKDRRVSAATANREAGNYGTSRTNNPMIDDAMKARMRQREDAAGVGPVKDGTRYAADVKSNTQGVGPVKDGTRYASNVKASPTTAGKKKEDETKTMSIAERMRRRRAGLA